MISIDQENDLICVLPSEVLVSARITENAQSVIFKLTWER